MITVKELETYCINKPGAYRDLPFGEVPICYKLHGKVFAQIYPKEGDYKITVKCSREDGEFYRQAFFGVVVRGYFCPPVQQPYWNTVYVEKIDREELLGMIDLAYKRVFEKFSKKVQRQLKEELGITEP